jgi:hypothetical protein
MLHVSRCDQCGQVDDHPKVHTDVHTYHHDCLSVDLRDQIIGSSEHGRAIIEAAESGVHGHELREHILGLHKEA